MVRTALPPAVSRPRAGQALIIKPWRRLRPGGVPQCRGFTATAHFKNMFIPDTREHLRVAALSCRLHGGALDPDPPEPDARGVQGRVPRATPAPKLPPNVSRPCAPSHHRCPLCRRRGPSIPPDLLRPARLGRERTSTSSNDQRPKSLISVAVLGAAILVAGARQKSVHHTTSAVGAGGRCVQGDVRCEPQRSTTNSAATTTDAIKLLRCCWPLAEPCGAPWATCRPPFVGRAACPMHSLKTQPQPAGRRSGTLCEAAWRDWRCGWC